MQRLPSFLHAAINESLNVVALAMTGRENWTAPAGAIEELRLVMRALDLSPDAHDAWARYCRLLQAAILQSDPSSFLRWKFVRRAMCLTNHVFLRNELRYLQSRPDWHSRWRPALSDPPIGNPIRCVFHPSTVGNTIHLAYHIAQWEAWSGCNIAQLGAIVEFGGGYGAMARLARALGFSGHYFILDLPQFGALQRFYLECCGLRDVHTFGDLAQLRARLPGRAEGPQMFLANISLSETPLEVRRPIEPIARAMEHVLITYQPRFHDVDNDEYFRDWQRDGRLWARQELPNFPGRCWYLFGKADPSARRDSVESVATVSA